MNNNQVKKNWILLIFGLTFSVLFLLGGIIYALDIYDSGYRVDHGQSKDVTIASASGQCHKVINNHSSNDYFIPTKTQAEWDAFAAHLPPGVSVGSCCTSHDHQACYDGDVYWYDSCNNREEKAQECGTSGYTGSNYCYNNDVYRNYVTRGCSGGSCTQSTSRIKQEECGAAGCSGGSCNTCVPGDYYDWTGTCEEFCAAMGGSAVVVGILNSVGNSLCEDSYDILSNEIWKEECDVDVYGSPSDPEYNNFETYTMCRCSCP